MEWIDVNKKLPEKEKSVLLWNEYSHSCQIGYLIFKPGEEVHISSGYGRSKFTAPVWDSMNWAGSLQEEITHWMELPQPPNKNEEV